MADDNEARDARAEADAPISDTGSGMGRVLIAVYGVFALAATGRSAVQLLTKYAEAPLAYLLSATAALIYIVAAWALARPGPLVTRVAWTAVLVELVGVLGVGTLTVVSPALFPDDTVWSRFGSGYGFVPLVLPVLGLVWLRRTTTAPVGRRRGGVV